MAETGDSRALPAEGPTDRPAIGIVASAEHPESVLREVLRAHRLGLDTFVHANGHADYEVVELAKYAGAAVVEGGVAGNGLDPRVHLRQVARAKGYPGLIYAEELAKAIDVPRSIEQFEEGNEYVIEAKSRSSVAPRTSSLVAIPAYNEAATIADVVARASAHADEVLVIDDGSKDKTAARALDAGATVVQHEFNRGYGAALKTAFQQAAAAKVDQLVVIDGDGQHNPHDISQLVGTLRETGADIVVGSRFSQGSKTKVPLYRRLGITVVNWLTNLSLGAVRPRSQISDTQSGFRAYGRRAIDSLAADPSLGNGMGVSTDIIHHAHSHNYDIAEVGTTMHYDVTNGNSHNPLEHGYALVRNLLLTVERKRPVLFLGVPGFLSVFTGLVLGYMAMALYLERYTLPVGLALAAMFFFLTGIFAGFTGMILHALKQMNE